VGREDRIRSEGKVSKPSFLLEAKVGKRERERRGGRATTGGNESNDNTDCDPSYVLLESKLGKTRVCGIMTIAI